VQRTHYVNVKCKKLAIQDNTLASAEEAGAGFSYMITVFFNKHSFCESIPTLTNRMLCCAG